MMMVELDRSSEAKVHHRLYYELARERIDGGGPWILSPYTKVHIISTLLL